MESAILKMLGHFEKRAYGMADNPASHAVAAFMMQQPPGNLPLLGQLYAQKLEKDLRQDLEHPTPMEEDEADPLRAENTRLSRMLDNLRMKKELMEKQKELKKIQMEMQAEQQEQMQAMQMGAMQAHHQAAQQQAAMAQQQGMAPNPAAAAAGPAMAQQAGGQPQGPQGIGPAEAAAM